jgi:hypothetical protein
VWLSDGVKPFLSVSRLCGRVDNQGALVSDAGGHEARYVSVSTVENMAPSDTYQSIDDQGIRQAYAHGKRKWGGGGR